MLPYLLVAVSPILISMFFPKLKTKEKSKILFLVFSGLVLVLFIGLRSKNLGSADSFNYYRVQEGAFVFGSWRSYYNPDYVEGGFQFLVYVISRCFGSAQWLFIITAIIYVGSICYFIYHNSEDLPLSMVMYITLGLMQFHMQGMRQAIAMSICLFAYEQAKRRNLVKFLLICFLATLFHQTAIIFFVVYIITAFDFNLRTLAFMFALSLATLLFSTQLTELANDIFERDYTNIADGGGYVKLAIYLLTIGLIFVFESRLQEKKEITSLLYVTMLGFVFFLFRYFAANMGERISFYFVFPQIVLLPRVLNKFTASEKIFLRSTVIMLCSVLFLYNLSGNNFFPYRFFW